MPCFTIDTLRQRAADVERHIAAHDWEAEVRDAEDFLSCYSGDDDGVVDTFNVPYGDGGVYGHDLLSAIRVASNQHTESRQIRADDATECDGAPAVEVDPYNDSVYEAALLRRCLEYWAAAHKERTAAIIERGIRAATGDRWADAHLSVRVI